MPEIWSENEEFVDSSTFFVTTSTKIDDFRPRGPGFGPFSSTILACIALKSITGSY
jgi:hypothetical protein